MSDMMKMFVEPEVPKVATDIPVLKDETVAVVLMYGECKPYIIGRCF